MTFNSLPFLLFLPLVFSLYWAFGRHRSIQNMILLSSSLVFYGWWDWRFCALLCGMVCLTWLVALKVGSGAHGRRWLWFGIAADLLPLVFFKYFNFFHDSAAALLNAVGLNANPSTLRIVLPIGISFYTFQMVGYLIDVYKRKTPATRDFLAYAASVAFFPKLAMGPIERSVDWIPQFLNPRSFDYPKAVDGCRQILWGLFKKTVVADNCAAISNSLLCGWADGRCMTTAVAVFAYTIQLYADFSGYSDMAVGLGRLFGFDIVQNFRFPYFSRNMAEFWRRWHVSLMTWLRDYVYIPLGGSRCTMAKRIRNTFVVFLVSGLWHGASWTFVIWGFLHACCFLPLLILGAPRYGGPCAEGRRLPSPGEAWRMALTFLCAMSLWTVFLAPDLATLARWLGSLASFGGGFAPSDEATALLANLPWIGLMFALEWMNRAKTHGLSTCPTSRAVRWGCYWLLVLVVFLFKAPAAESPYFEF